VTATTDAGIRTSLIAPLFFSILLTVVHLPSVNIWALEYDIGSTTHRAPGSSIRASTRFISELRLQV
jgi:hypothetical protein